MKFYKVTNYIYWSQFINSKLNAIYCDANIRFLKNGKHHNPKNAAFINYKGDKQYILNGKYYGNHKDFTKETWRRFVNLNVFL